jgi:transcriptional regulator of met regulon
MPAMANITVKKADDTTDVIYVAISPSAGDKVPAIWQVTASQPIKVFDRISRSRPRRTLRERSESLRWSTVFR